MSRPHRRRAAAPAVLVLVAAVAGCGLSAPASDDGGAAPPGAPTGPTTVGAATAELQALAVKGRAPRTGYSRERFGPSWRDVDRNGCDTRNDVLARDLADETLRPGTQGCVVLSGTLADPYTGRTLQFRKSDPSEVQIDHVVALSDAWQTGAQQWGADRRLAFANDPRNLQATDGGTNQQKGDSDAASWLPPNRSYRCTYVSRQIDVKAAYGLWVTRAERDAMTRVLSSCE